MAKTSSVKEISVMETEELCKTIQERKNKIVKLVVAKNAIPKAGIALGRWKRIEKVY